MAPIGAGCSHVFVSKVSDMDVLFEYVMSNKNPRNLGGGCLRLHRSPGVFTAFCLTWGLGWSGVGWDACIDMVDASNCLFARMWCGPAASHARLHVSLVLLSQLTLFSRIPCDESARDDSIEKRHLPRN